MIFVTYDLLLSNGDGLSKLNALQTLAKSKGYKVIAMTGSSPEIIETVKKQYKFNFEFYFCDATALKTIERANPSIVILNNGTVVKKVHYNDIDNIQLVNINGQLMMEIKKPSFDNHTFSIDNLQQGFYFLKLSSDNQSVTKKVIVN